MDQQARQARCGGAPYGIARPRAPAAPAAPAEAVDRRKKLGTGGRPRRRASQRGKPEKSRRDAKFDCRRASIVGEQKKQVVFPARDSSKANVPSC